MPILRKIETKFGVDAEFHRILGISIDYDEKYVIAKVGLFVNQDADDRGKPPIEVYQERFDTTGSTANVIGISWVYERLRERLDLNYGVEEQIEPGVETVAQEEEA